MKIKKILAGISAMAIAATMAAIPASAADKTQTLWVAKDWTACLDDPTFAKNVTSGDAWDGFWVQFYTSDKDLSKDTITFTIDTSKAAWQEDDKASKPMNETGTYTVMRAFNTALSNKQPGGDECSYTENKLTGDFKNVTLKDGVYTITLTGTELAKIAKEQSTSLAPSEEKATDDKTEKTVYNVGFNIQFGHFESATWSASVSGSNVMTMKASEDKSGNAIPAVVFASSSNSSKNDTSSNGSKNDTSSNNKSDSSSNKSDSNTNGSDDSNNTNGSSNNGSTANKGNAATGAAAGVALACVALAGAAVIVSKKK